MMQVRCLASCTLRQVELVWDLAVGSSESNATRILAADVEAARACICCDGKDGIMQRQPVHMLSSSNEWCTPTWILDLTRQVFQGGIDLDPCSNDLAQPSVQAKKTFDQHADGLQQTWAGKVFVNPPFGLVCGQSHQGLFLKKAVAEYNEGHVSEVLLLLKAAVGYAWFGCALNYPHAWLRDHVAFHATRPSSYLDEDHARLVPLAANPHGSIMVYLGPNVRKFAEVFSQVAFVPGVSCWAANMQHP